MSIRLKAAGFSEEQAEAQAEALNEAVRDGLVTRLDLNEAVEKIRVEIRDQNSALLRWIIPLMIGQTAAVAALVKLL